MQSFSNSFEGGTGFCEKIWVGLGVLYFRILLHFYDPIFRNLLRGYMRCPPLPHLCVHLWTLGIILNVHAYCISNIFSICLELKPENFLVLDATTIRSEPIKTGPIDEPVKTGQVDEPINPGKDIFSCSSTSSKRVRSSNKPGEDFALG